MLLLQDIKVMSVVYGSDTSHMSDSSHSYESIKKKRYYVMAPGGVKMRKNVLL